MKKIIVISILCLFFVNSYSQKITNDEWIKYINTHQIAGLTLNPGRFGIGAFYITKRTWAGSFMASFSTGNFLIENENIKSQQFGIGWSFPVKTVSIDLIPIYDNIDNKYFNIINPISIDMGFHFIWTLSSDRKICTMITTNPFLFSGGILDKMDIKIYFGIPF